MVPTDLDTSPSKAIPVARDSDEPARGPLPPPMRPEEPPPEPPLAPAAKRWSAGIGAGLLGYLGIGELLEEEGVAQLPGFFGAGSDAIHDGLIVVAVAAAFGTLLLGSRQVRIVFLALVGLTAVAAALWLDSARPAPRALDSTESPSGENATDFRNPVAVSVRFLAGQHKNPGGSCVLATRDYALAVGGTWEAPELRFFADGSPATADDPATDRQDCTSPSDTTWTASFDVGEVVIWPLR